MAFRNIPPNGFPALPDLEDLEAVVKSVSTLTTSVSGLAEDVGDLEELKANKTDIATEFSDLTNYNAGDLVYYEGDLYEFQVDHTAGDWETSEVIQKDLSDIVTTLKSGLTSLDFGKLQYDGTSVDINTVLTNGWHYGSSTGSGLDTVDDYYMLVFHLGNYIKQFIIGKFGYGKKLYMRYSGDGGTTWSVSKVEFTDVT